MSLAVTTGATLQCTFGASLTLNVTSQANVVQTLPVATIMDYAPMANLIPAGVCTSLANPTVASATAAAWGVLTPMPCIPATVAPWVPGSPTILSGNFPTLNTDSKLMCSYGGCISITSPGQVPVQCNK